MPINTVILMGRLVKDPEIKETANDNKFCQNTIAINKGNGATFIPFTVWGGTAEFLHKYFKKGNNILIEGYLKNGQFLVDDKKFQTIEIVGKSLSFIDPPVKEDKSSEPKGNNANADIDFTDILDDGDLPF